ncbi:MAG: DNA-binding response regulator [Candidatus Viridilinea halotolerans]|uniref:DNA-binding response regulator n=1 Tax=Candidatus Viridilinea halotolerans TaxID=2491704 RepID=A0A426TVA1_9CHLR|nr:MAG: DNA-binding response regulator [Candidatus Viridilinea halotolerans]
MTTIVLVDDHPMVRGGLRAALSAEEGWQVIGEAPDGESGIALAQQLRPAILVVDMQMPGMNGLEVLRHVRTLLPAMQVILFSMHSEDAYVREALACGAAGYVLKEADAVELIHAIRVALQGGRYLSPSLTERTISAYLHQPAPDLAVNWIEMLTARERQVLLLAAQGLANSDIGDRLNISPRTAETHRTNLMRKLGLKTPSELDRFVQEHGLIG